MVKEQKKTGGGPAPKMPSALTAKVIGIFKETPSFTGLKGLESTGKDFKYPFITSNLQVSTYFFKNDLV